MNYYHKPVLIEEVIDILSPKPYGVFLDATLGGGGHFESIIKRAQNKGIFIGLDQDKDAIENAKLKFKDFCADIRLINDNFKNIKRVINKMQIQGLNGIIFDLGVSSYQLDNVSRGFSYRADAKLDMRMDQTQNKSAFDVVNYTPENELKKIIWEYGEEKWANRIANFIVKRRKKKEIKTTLELSKIIKDAIPARARRTGGHPAKRTFQALRIYVNDELNILSSALCAAVDILKPGGKICVISFHSLEDRIVKHTFKRLSSDCICSKDIPICICNHKRTIDLLTRKPITPSKKEIDANPRSQSAKLRAAIKL